MGLPACRRTFLACRRCLAACAAQPRPARPPACGAMQCNAGLPCPMEQDPSGIEPENESLEAASGNPLAALRAKLDKLQGM